MNYPEKQLKYSIRKVSVGAASVVIGALYLLMGAGIAHADGMESAREANRTANPADADQSGTGEPGNKADLNNTDAVASTYNALVAENPLVAPESAKPRRIKRDLSDGETGGTSNGATGTESGNNQPTGENSPVLDANRKGETVKDDQPGVHVPKDGENGSDDKNAHLRFDDPGEKATVEEMWKIIQKMPDDFQNNERSYLRNMNTLGDALRFDEKGKVTKDESGRQLQDGEIREINEFGGWKAINGGTFAIGKKNAQGYFTGWYYKKGSTTEKEQGGMLGSNALDQIFVHEQALDRRFKYMLMLAKGRTIANKEDKAQDETKFDIKTANKVGDQAKLNNLPVKDKEDILQHSPNIEGFNGIEKTFTAFSTRYGSRLKIDFVTGYISDYEGSKGTYRIVVTAIKKGETDGTTKEETIYDHTINRIDGIVENEERYSQGVDLSTVNSIIKKLFKDEHSGKVQNLAKERYKEQHPETRNPRLNQYKSLIPIIEKELAQKGEAIYELPIDKDELHEVEKNGKPSNNFKDGSVFTGNYATVANRLNTLLKRIEDTEVIQNSPIWMTPNEPKSKDPDRVYNLLNFILPTAKKIIYHADTDQLELETDPKKVKNHREKLKAELAGKEALLKTTTDDDETTKTKLNKEISALKSAIGSTNAYTYLEARNGSKVAKILGSHMEAKTQPGRSEISEAEYEKYYTNERAATHTGRGDDGLAKFTNYFVEKENVTRSNVLSDEELSKEIEKQIGGDNEKLGKGGYFSTGDIPLDKDVVAYKIQVFAENKKRVGVNKQSPRLQYNLPILADFSVIQDTVEPSKEVAKRIIDKQIKENKIPKEEGEKLKGKIDESKKTSEVRKAISGNVKVRYVNEQGQDIPLSEADAKKVGEKSENGTYFVEKEALIGTSYDVTSKKLRGINAGEKKYRLKRSLNDGLYAGSEAVTGSVTSTDKIVTFVYEEGEPAKAKAVVHVKKQQEAGDPVELVDHKLNLETEVGEEFPSEPVNNKVEELQKLGYEIIGNTFTNGTEEERKGDEVEDKDGEEPSQSYTITIKEKVETVTTPPTPNTPIDPTIPEGPKWPETGLKESDLKKEVTRTITYVKKETADGQEEPSGVEDKVDKVLFKRTATYNVVTKKITYGEWTATTDESHPASQLPAVDTPLKTGYVADIKQVEGQDAPKPTETGEITNINKKVVYTKLGSWVPKIPGKTPTPIPYPNNPTDPTKPKYPDYPTTPVNPGETPNPQPENPGGNNTPGGGNETPGGETPGTPEKPKTPELPVIPYEPGYTPKIGETPLEPVDPKDPKKGYKVPEIPKDPQNNTIIEYKPNPQKILIKVVNVTTGEEVELPKEKLEFNGVSDQVVTTEDREKVDNKIASLKQRGYIVSTKNPISETTKYDTKDDSTEPTQIYKIVVNELISKDKEIIPVTRTIKYVQIDVKDGKEVKTELNTEKIKTKVDKVEFSRDASTSLTTYITKFGNWDAETKELLKVDTPVLDGYLANVASVENKTVQPATESYEVTVEYRKIGSWVLTPPTGVTPPDGSNFEPKPYPNHPTDPTKPGTPVYPEPGIPKDPNTPEPPVIPYVPGYTPMVPTDPTKPVDPNTNPLKPLVPVEPEHPGKGYKVPDLPKTPETNTPITYAADPQKAVVKVYNVKDSVETELTNDKLTMNGKTDEVIPTQSLKDKIEELKKRGYIIDEEPLKNGEKFDSEKDSDSQDPTQVFKLKVREKLIPVTPPTEDEPLEPGTPIDPDAPVVPNTPNDPLIPTWTEELINKVKNAETTKEVTRTINYVDESNNKVTYTVNGKDTTDSKTDKVTFTREAKINVVTKEITYGEWTATDNDRTFDAVLSPVVKGYILKSNQDSQGNLVSADGTSVAASENLTEASKNQNVNVVYTKLGSWVLTPPTGVTPPEGTNFDPKPYPNHPTDPTKPGTPVYPEPGQPITPGTPVIPYVPGYTPKIGDKPLEPVDPNYPEKGYKVPPVPETPGKDTPITYGGNPQKILIKVVNVTTGVEVPLDNEKLEFNGKSGETVKETDKNSVDAKITSLRNRGYIVDTVNPLTATTKYDTESDAGKQEPTQTYKLVVREKISADKESTTVTRTIKYVKVDVQDGKEVRTELNTEKIKTKVDKVEFSRDTTTNLTTGLTEIGTWNHEKQEFPKVDTPVLEGYLANKVSVPSKEVTPESDSIEEVVEYRKIGSWIPKVPGKEEPTPIPYPNDPDDPTKPKTPDYPTTPPQPGQPVPKVPVIPYVPGYTPKTPNGTPLVPIDPEHPEKGYKVPPVPETPNDPKLDTPIEYTPDGQRAIVKFVVVGEDGKETELVASRMSLTGKTGEKIPTENFNDTLKKLTGDPVNNGDYELVDNPLKDGATFDNVKDEEGKDPSQVFVVKLHQIYVIPPTPRIVERPSGNTVEVDVPNKDADTLSITFTKRNSTEKETIVTKKDKDGTWKIEKSPVGVTINPTNGRVYIPSKQIQPKTWVDTQTKHKYKQSKIVRVMPNILDVPKFEGTTEWIDVNGHVLRPTEDGFHEKGRIANHVWLESRLEGNKVTHIFFAGSPSVDKPEYKITVWFDKDGNPLKPDQPGTHEAGNIPGYRYITTVTLDGITIHRFEKIPPVLPNEPIPDRPEEPRPQPNPEHPSVPTPSPELPNQETPIPVPDTPSPETPVSPDPEVPTDETGKREELPNTGTEANAGLAGAGLLTLLAGLGLGFFKRKEDESE